jgi:hypothetical protein
MNKIEYNTMVEEPNLHDITLEEIACKIRDAKNGISRAKLAASKFYETIDNLDDLYSDEDVLNASKMIITFESNIQYYRTHLHKWKNHISQKD